MPLVHLSFRQTAATKTCFVVKFMQPEGIWEAAHKNEAKWQYRRRTVESAFTEVTWQLWIFSVCSGPHWHHGKCTSCSWCCTSTTQDPPPETSEITEQDLADVIFWAIPALMLHEEAGEQQLHKAHHSRAAVLSQRLAAGEKEERKVLILKTMDEQKEMKQTMRSIALQDKEGEQSVIQTEH